MSVYDPPAWYSGSGSDMRTTRAAAIGTLMAGGLAPKPRTGDAPVVRDPVARDGAGMTAPAVSLPTAAAKGGAKGGPAPARLGQPGLLGPFMVLYVLFLVGPLLYDVVMSFFNTSLVTPRARAASQAWGTPGALQRQRFWQADVAHDRVHPDQHAAAGAAPAVLRDCGEPDLPRPVVLPAGLFPALHPSVGRHRAHLALAVRAGVRARRRVLQPDRGDRPGLAVVLVGGLVLDRHRHRVVDDRLQLHPLPGRPPGHLAGPVRGGRARRGQPLEQTWRITLPLLGRTTTLV